MPENKPEFFLADGFKPAKIVISSLLLWASVSRADNPIFDFNLVTLPTDLVATVVSIEDDIAISVELPTEGTQPVIPKLIVATPTRSDATVNIAPDKDIEPAPALIETPEPSIVSLNTEQDQAPETREQALIAKNSDQFKSTVALITSTDSDQSGAEVAGSDSDTVQQSVINGEVSNLDPEPMKIVATIPTTPEPATPPVAELSLPAPPEPDIEPVAEVRKNIETDAIAAKAVGSADDSSATVTEIAAAVETEIAAEVETEIATEVETEIAAEVETEIAAEAEIEIAVETEIATEVENKAVTQLDFEPEVASIGSTTTGPVIDSAPATIEPVPLDQVVTEEQEQRINEDEIILAWAAAWSSNDIEGYLAFYDDNFIPSDPNVDRESWEQLRRKRLKNQNIRIIVSNAEVYRADDNLTEVRFTQRYTSSSYRDRVIKAIEMVQTSQGGWKFVSERTIEKLAFK